MGRARMSREQVKNMRYIIGRAKEEGFPADVARLAACVAHAESSLGERPRGRGTISGIYNYTDGAWENRAGVYRYDKTEPNENMQFKDFEWKTNKNLISAQVSVFLADLDRYGKEFEMILDKESPEKVYGNDPQGMKAWERFVDPANNIPFTFEDYAYLRHNTSVRETKRVNENRRKDSDGVYEAIRNLADLVYNPLYEPGPDSAPFKDAPDEDEDQYHAPGPSPGM